MKAEGLTNSKFASILGIQRSNITHIIDGRNKPSLSFIEKLITKFPRVNIEWLMTGTGEMYKQNKTSKHKDDDSPTLFSEIPITQGTTNQKENQTASQVIKQDSPEVSKVINIHPNHELKTQIETVALTKKTPTIQGNQQNAKQHISSEPESIEIIKDREIECVLIFHSDKTFKYYKPE
jgi:predicted transcriptional regulator